MTKHSHYVVAFNHETHEFENDVDSAMSRFPDGWIYNDEMETWEFAQDEETYGNDTDGGDILTTILREYNYIKEIKNV